MRLKTLLKPGGGERGSSLIEVLVAMLIMLFLMIAVLQMFSMAFLLNLGSAARTDMSHKCEQVVETIRLVEWVRENGGTIYPDVTTEIPNPLAAGTYEIPYSGVGSTYWGPQYANIMESDDVPYRLRYTVTDGDLGGLAPGCWVVSVEAYPKPGSASGLRKYAGIGIDKKRVDYVAQIPK